MAVVMTLHRSLLPFVLIVASMTLGLIGARAAPARDATSFVDAFVREALNTLGDKQLSAHSREDRFAKILDEDFDFPRIARFTVGRHWSSTGEQDRDRFVSVFRRWVIRVYSARLSGYSGETVKITGSRPETETMSTVTSQVIRTNGAPPIRIDWRVRRDNGDDYRVVDVAIDGVSMLLTQREEFASAIERNGGTVAGLTRALEQRIASGDTGGGTKVPP